MRRISARMIVKYVMVVSAAGGFLVGFIRSNQTSSWSFMPSSDAVLGIELESEHESAKWPPYFNKPQWWKTKEHKTTLITNRTCVQYYFLLILVSSAPANFDTRNTLRKTWARDNELMWPRWMTFFLVGQTRLQTESMALIKEQEDFGDLVRGNYFEDYYNQTHKIQMGFEWANKYCEYSFLMKTDDDVFVDTVKIISYLNELTTPNKEFYVGNLNSGMEPIRDNTSRWYVTEDEYFEQYYPDYCSGFAFILSYDVVALFVEVFDHVPFFKIDDVYVGMLARETGILPRHKTGFEVLMSDQLLCRPLAETLARHYMPGDCLTKIYNHAIKNRKYFL